MKRTKEWWARLTKEERVQLVYLERSIRFSTPAGRSSDLPEDCGECGACGNPHCDGGLCRSCNRALDRLINKANLAH